MAFGLKWKRILIRKSGFQSFLYIEDLDKRYFKP